MQSANAQSVISELIKSGPGDATKLVNAYAQPLFKGFGVNNNSGWANTARTKGLLKFELRVTASASLVPQSDKSFDVTKIGLSNHIGPADNSQTIAPTISGSGNQGPLLNIYDDQGRKVDQFNTPGGKISVIPSPQVQLTIGLPKNTDITLRGMPKVDLGKDIGSVSMIGFGIKHNILRDFAGKTADKVIPLDLALALGYSRLNYTIPLDVQPGAGAQPIDGKQSTDFSNQHGTGHFDSFIVQVIVSKKIAVFTPFLSVGYNTSKSNLGIIGNYPVTSSSLGGQSFYTTFTNPVSIKETSISSVRADIGFQLNLGFFRFYTSYGAAKYQTLNAGIGFGI